MIVTVKNLESRNHASVVREPTKAGRKEGRRWKGELISESFVIRGLFVIIFPLGAWNSARVS